MRPLQMFRHGCAVLACVLQMMSGLQAQDVAPPQGRPPTDSLARPRHRSLASGDLKSAASEDPDNPTSDTISSATPTPASPFPSSVVTVQPIPQVTVSFLGASGGTTTVVTGKTPPFPLPAGFQPGPAPIYYQISTTSNFYSVVVCIQYDPRVLPGPERSLSLLHYDKGGGWVPVTLALPDNPSLETHTICGQAPTLSPFVVGTASLEILFESLLADFSSLPSSTTPGRSKRNLHAQALAAKVDYDHGKTKSAADRLEDLMEDLSEQAGALVGSNDANRLLNETKVILRQLTGTDPDWRTPASTSLHSE